MRSNLKLRLQLRHVSFLPPCRQIRAISLHLLPDRWKQLGEPWVRWKAPAAVLSPPFCCSDFCSCVGGSPLSEPRANKKGNWSRLPRQHRTQQPLLPIYPPPLSHTHTQHTHRYRQFAACACSDVWRRRHRASVWSVRDLFVGWSRGTFHDLDEWATMVDGMSRVLFMQACVFSLAPSILF